MSGVATAGRTAGVRQRGVMPRRRTTAPLEPSASTLDDRISALWQRLVETGAAQCPVCAATVSAGRPCEACGSELT